MIAHFDQIEVSWSSTLFITEDVKTSHLIPRFPSTLQENELKLEIIQEPLRTSPKTYVQENLIFVVHLAFNILPKKK